MVIIIIGVLVASRLFNGHIGSTLDLLYKEAVVDVEWVVEREKGELGIAGLLGLHQDLHLGSVLRHKQGRLLNDGVQLHSWGCRY